MLKKSLLCIVTIFIFSSFTFRSVLAYDYVDKSNEKIIEGMIQEIYDMKTQYEDLAGKLEEKEEDDTEMMTSDNYWWPIGSAETETSDNKTFASGDPETVSITSPFGYRLDPFGSGSSTFHSGLDIAGGSGLGSVNIIAAKDGTVVYSTKGSFVCSSGTGQDSCGGGYGNHIIIQHTDGNYTLYAHLYENSILVSEGDSVKQGQVIAKMGSSGFSTGAHLHFEVREGQNAYSAAVDPLNYIDPDNPRPANASDKLVKYIEYWEGHTDIVGDSYLVVDIGDGVRTVGPGIVLEYNSDKFSAHGINVDDYTVGSTIPISIVDAIEKERINEDKSSIESRLAENGITLKPHQIDALVSFQFNCGSGAVDDFISKYKIYGDTQELYDNCMGNYVHVYGEVWDGLVVRRKSEWNLFHNGVYDVLE